LIIRQFHVGYDSSMIRPWFLKVLYVVSTDIFQNIFDRRLTFCCFLIMCELKLHIGKLSSVIEGCLNIAVQYWNSGWQCLPYHCEDLLIAVICDRHECLIVATCDTTIPWNFYLLILITPRFGSHLKIKFFCV